MKKLFILLLLIVLSYVVFSNLYKEVKRYSQAASLIMSGITQRKVESAVVKAYQDQLNISIPPETDIKIMYEYIDTDTKADIVAIAKGSRACGSAGCIPILLLQNEFNELKPIAFSYAVKKITVSPYIHNGMHDLLLNDQNKPMVWNGTMYEPETF